MEKGLLKKIFLDTKNNLDMKGYIFTIFFTVIFYMLPYYFLSNMADVQVEKINLENWFLLLFMIFFWVIIFKGKIYAGRENILKFILNNILFFGILLFADNIISQKVFYGIQSVQEREEIVFWFVAFFAAEIKDIFILFTAFSGVLALSGKEKISFVEGGKIFKNSLGKFFTAVFFCMFYELYVAGISYIRWCMFEISNPYSFYPGEYFAILTVIIKVFFFIYLLYFAVVFVSAVFKNSLEKSEETEISEKNITADIFEETITALKGRKTRFYGMIALIYILCGIVIVIVSFLFAIMMYRFFMYYSFTAILIAVLAGIGIATLTQIFVVKSCFKFLEKPFGKIDFSKFMKIYGGVWAVTILAFIFELTIEKILFVMYRLLLKNFGIENVIPCGMDSFIVFYLGIIQVLITIFVLENEKGVIKKSFKESMKFLSWKYALVVFGIYQMSELITASLSEFYSGNIYEFALLVQRMTHVPFNIVMIFMVFVFIQTMTLFVIKYTTAEKK